MSQSVLFIVAELGGDARPFILHVFGAAVAKKGRWLTKTPLTEAKGRGSQAGRDNAERLAAAYQAEALRRAEPFGPLLRELMCAGMSARGMAAELNRRGTPTALGGTWHAQTVIRVLKRLGLVLDGGSVGETSQLSAARRNQTPYTQTRIQEDRRRGPDPAFLQKVSGLAVIAYKYKPLPACRLMKPAYRLPR
jgi:hypothetical protein